MTWTRVVSCFSTCQLFSKSVSCSLLHLEGSAPVAPIVHHLPSFRNPSPPVFLLCFAWDWAAALVLGKFYEFLRKERARSWSSRTPPTGVGKQYAGAVQPAQASRTPRIVTKDDLWRNVCHWSWWWTSPAPERSLHTFRKQWIHRQKSLSGGTVPKVLVSAAAYGRLLCPKAWGFLLWSHRTW